MHGRTPELPWLPDLVTRHQSIIDRRLGHGDLKRWSEAMSRIPSMDPASRTLGRAVGLEHIPEAAEQQLEMHFVGLCRGAKVHSSLGPSTSTLNGAVI